MARSTWSGYLSFGLVSIPVGLFTATSDQTVHFNQLHKGTSNRVRYKKIDEATGEELSTDDIVNGYPVGDGEYVVVTKEELKEAAPGKSDVIEITDFVELHEIDPMYFRQTYYLAPRNKSAERAYALLLEAMRGSAKVGVATLVLRDKEHLVAVRPGEDVLMLETMYFANEIHQPREQLDGLPEMPRADARELAIAKQLIDSLTDTWDPSRYKNTYRDRVEELIERKREGRAVVVRTHEEPTSNVIDLMDALRASIERSSKTKVEAVARTPEPPPAPAAAAKNEQQTFEGMSKAELLERAAKLAVKGRTTMTKLQLVQALTEAEQPKRRRRVS